MKSKSFEVAILCTTIVAIVVLWFSFWYRPGGPGNPHEWLNETMKREAVKGANTQAALGHWHFADDNSNPHLSNMIDFESDMHISVVQVSKATYSMLEITLPDGRTFVADYCLKHGEFVLRKRKP